MPKISATNEEKIIDLLEKNLIVQLYINGATRDQIKKMLKMSSTKVSDVIKYIRKGERNG